MPFRLGLIVNPFAGIGGSVALKGSDGAAVREAALAAGAIPQANPRTAIALSELQAAGLNHRNLVIVTVAGDMGERVARAHDFAVEVVFTQSDAQSEASDTIAAVKAIEAADVDLLVFAGGDGTARNVCSVVSAEQAVLGIPCGCKIHSGVYAISPKAAGIVIAQMVQGQLVSALCAEVRDIDESAFRDGKVIAKHYGEMLIPESLQYVQAVKMGGKESDELVLADLAADIEELMDDHPNHYFVMGSGSTVDFIATEMGFSNTLLGVDVVHQGQVVTSDITAQALFELIQGKPTKLIITVIGGQGHVFGRGNQQLSPAVIKAIGRDNIIIVATKAKLQELSPKPLIADTGDPQLDEDLSGVITVTTGYRDKVLYKLGV